METTTPVFSIALIATDPDAPESTPISEAHWELTAQEAQSVSAAFVARVYSQTGRGNMVFHVLPITC